VVASQNAVTTHIGDDSEKLTLEGVYSVQIKISARHGHLSDETQSKIKEKLEKLPRYYDRLSSIDVTVDLEHRDAPNVDLRVSAEHKHDFVAVCHSAELMAGVDEVVEKMEQQLVKYKTKIQDRHRGPGHRQVGETLPPESPEDEEASADA
jgi:putative sigma-54 modulation protein